MNQSLDLSQNVCMLRRYARALLGSQAAGDDAVHQCLVALQKSAIDVTPLSDPKVSLYQTFSRIVSSRIVSGHALSVSNPENNEHGQIDQALGHLDLITRQCFLLTSLEEFSIPQVSVILDLPQNMVLSTVNQAITQLSAQPQANIMIVEDEPIIALDLQAIVQSMGHVVGGIARTHARAVDMAKQIRPDLVLADIRLADESSGVDVAMDILTSQDIPVIFITAYPQQLLTGKRPEPTFLIRKPFSQEQVRAAIAQALMFHARSHLHAA